jgi:hypothetical protein
MTDIYTTRQQDNINQIAVENIKMLKERAIWCVVIGAGWRLDHFFEHMSDMLDNEFDYADNCKTSSTCARSS